MKIKPVLLAALLMVPLTTPAQVVTVFNDTFTGGSTINSANPAPPTANSSSYEEVSAKAWSPTPTINGSLQFGLAKTSGGGVEVQAQFANTPVQLIDPGDFIQLTFTFTNVSGLLTQDTQFGAGMYNSAGSLPFGGGLNGNDQSSSTPIVANSGGSQNWAGYVGLISSVGAGKSSQIVSRAPQTGPDNRNQITMVPGNLSSLYGYNNPNGSVVGANSSSAETTFVVGGIYTGVLTFTLQTSNTMQIAISLYTNNTSGALLTSLTSTTTNAAITNAFDAFAIGWRSAGNLTATTIAISSIQVADYIQSQFTCVTAGAGSSSLVVGQTNVPFNIIIPPSSVASAPLSIDIVSTDPSVAYPAGAPSGNLTVTFPQNSPYVSTNVFITAATSGSTLFYITNVTAPACIASNSSTALTVNCGTVALTPAVATVGLGESDQTIQITLPNGANQNGSVTVNISNSNPSVASLPTSSVTFAQGGPATMNLSITPLAVGATSFTLSSISGSCASLAGTAAVNVICDPITLAPSSLISLVGQNNQIITVSLPAYAVAAGSISVDLKSLNPAVAVAQGATGDTLTLHFAQGGTNAQTVNLNVLGTGTATLVLINANISSGCASTLTNATLLVTVPATAQITNKLENFDSQSGASSNGWTDFNDQGNGENYGFSATGNAGGDSGEAGGIFIRYTNRNYYADTQIGTLTLNDYVSASGQLGINPPSKNAAFNIGFFNTNSPVGNFAILGFALADGNYPLQRISAMVYPNNGLNTMEVFGPAMVEPPTVYYWSFSYDPTGGNGNGQLVLNYTDTSGVPEFSTNVNLTATMRASGATFNAFGMLVRGFTSLDATDMMGIYIDNLTYTKNVSLAPSPIPLQVQNNGGNVTLTWSNSVFSLETATNVAGPYSKITGATSPFTTNTVGSANFFRLVWP